MNRDRIRTLRLAKNDNDYILYIMSSSFRSHNNHSLEHALELVHETKKPLVIALFKLKEESERNNEFFLQGIANYEEVFAPVTSDTFLFHVLDDDLNNLITNGIRLCVSTNNFLLS